MTAVSRFKRLATLLLPSLTAIMVTTGISLPGWSAPVTQPTEAEQHPELAASATPEPPPLPLDALRAFTEVMQRIKSSYVEEVDDNTLLENAIEGMLSGLDPHSTYLNPDDLKELEISTSGKFGGLGIEVGMEEGLVKIITPIDDTPAKKAGLQPGDLIIKMDNTSVKGLTLSEAVEKMRGKPGEPITLTIIREGKPRPISVTLKREVIRVQSVKSRVLEEGYGYIRLSQFLEDSDKELIEHVKRLRKGGKNDKHALHGIVLDLRNNPGGILQAAVGTADAFIKKGTIVYTEGRHPNSNLIFQAAEDDHSGGVPLVVLINSGSASASEIVAGALQDHRRAVIVGTRSFGKGSVQTVHPLSVDHNRGLKLTTALYYTPNGRSIQNEGIVPDIIVPKAKLTPLEGSQHYREESLRGHLGEQTPEKLKRKDRSEKKSRNTEQLEDYQLNQALVVLKGMALGDRNRNDTLTSTNPKTPTG